MFRLKRGGGFIALLIRYTVVTERSEHLSTLNPEYGGLKIYKFSLQF